MAQPPAYEGVRGSCGGVVDITFGMRLREHLHCPECDQITHIVAPHVEHYHVVSAAALRMVALAAEDGPPDDVAEALRFVEQQQQKMCDKDLAGCGTPGVSALLGLVGGCVAAEAWHAQVAGGAHMAGGFGLP